MSKARDLGGMVNSSISSAELGYIDGVTSNIQTQLDSKLATDTAASTYAPSSTAVTLTGSQTLTNKSISRGIVYGPRESTGVSNYSITGLLNVGYSEYPGVLYLTSNASGNWSLNFRNNSSTTLNSILSVNDSWTFNILVTNGTTAYYPTAFQIDGTSVTPKWSGGTAPSAGNASAIDAYSFTIIKTADATFTVFAAGPIKYA